jgi:hypothetical protein
VVVFLQPVSPGTLVQRIITAKPGVHVLTCFMTVQDRLEHTRLGMLP